MPKEQVDQVFPGESFKVELRTLGQGNTTHYGPFLELADGLLKEVQDYKSRRPQWAKFASGLLGDNWVTVEHYDPERGTTKKIKTPLTKADILLAIAASDKGNGSQLWLMSVAKLIGEIPGYDIKTMKKLIENS